VLAAAALLVGLLATYPYATLSTVTLLYLAFLPWGWWSFRAKAREWQQGEAERLGAGRDGAYRHGDPARRSEPAAPQSDGSTPGTRH
jgi:threonine/homoserine/homoserine lactone efflux protein